MFIFRVVQGCKYRVLDDDLKIHFIYIPVLTSNTE